MEIKDIVFPVYPLRAHRRIFRGSKGAVFVETDFGEIKVLDDTSIIGTFSFRRLKLSIQLNQSKDFKLYNLPKSCATISSMVKNRTKYRTKKYIDSNGSIFAYKPNKFYALTYHRVVERYIIEGKCGVVRLQDINTSFKLPRLPPDNMKWAGLVHSEAGYLLYEFATEKLSNTRRKL